VIQDDVTPKTIIQTTSKLVPINALWLVMAASRTVGKQEAISFLAPTGGSEAELPSCVYGARST
jgi:hypothetical protein